MQRLVWPESLVRKSGREDLRVLRTGDRFPVSINCEEQQSFLSMNRCPKLNAVLYVQRFKCN